MAGRGWIAVGALLAALGVAAGAIGAHLLRPRLTPEALDLFETAVRYHQLHALALVLVGLLLAQRASRAAHVAAAAFLLGVVLFSGGIYGHVLGGLKPLVHVVPVGGGAWILGWLALAVAALRAPSA